jgi:Nicotinate-nucleotide pyrophosphorylase
MDDIREVLFQNISHRRFRAALSAERAGVLSGVAAAQERAAALGVELEICKREGDAVGRGERIGNLLAAPLSIAMAEESIIGTLAKVSGIATAAQTAVLLADGRSRIVSGSWKKMPHQLKAPVRQAVAVGGASFRIADTPMIYLDKNFIRMLGSISAALEAAKPFTEHTKVIQIRSEDGDVRIETEAALLGGANILMVDTGKLADLDCCIAHLTAMGAREQVQVAFAGNVRLSDIPSLCERNVDILCIGKEIIDAPLLDLKLDVIGEGDRIWD